jgi:hypothetical protein
MMAHTLNISVARLPRYQELAYGNQWLWEFLGKERKSDIISH